ncbi:hypothetical protein D3C84_1285050 [compost metagenome]
MHTATATLHVHPACACNPRIVAAIQASTGMLAVIHGGQPRLVARKPAGTTLPAPAPYSPFGGNAA